MADNYSTCDENKTWAVAKRLLAFPFAIVPVMAIDIVTLPFRILYDTCKVVGFMDDNE